jgi:hypothetical protein
MKTLLSLGLVLVLGTASASAQIFRPEAVSGAALGAIAGAIMGNNSGSLGHDGLRGAAWGAGIGLLAGQIAGDANADRAWRGTQVPPVRGGDVRYGRGPAYGVDSGPLVWDRPANRGDGVVLGAITGAIVGNNSGLFGHRGDRGAAWGAGIGYILGAINEQNARAVRRVPAPTRVFEVPSAPAAPAPQQITIINNYYNVPATAMTPANQLFGRN